MPRDIPIGNGNILIAFDQDATLREFYFPHVGEENHTKGEPFRFGAWINGDFSWISDEWNTSKNYLGDSLVTDVEFSNQDLKIRVNDLVDFKENIYLKKIKVENIGGSFTALRIGITTANALGYALNIPVEGTKTNQTKKNKLEFSVVEPMYEREADITISKKNLLKSVKRLRFGLWISC